MSSDRRHILTDSVLLFLKRHLLLLQEKDLSVFGLCDATKSNNGISIFPMVIKVLNTSKKSKNSNEKMCTSKNKCHVANTLIKKGTADFISK